MSINLRRPDRSEAEWRDLLIHCRRMNRSLGFARDDGE
jgi:hypothetical protein